MKSTALAFALALGFTTAQAQTAKLPKNANTVVIQTTDSAAVALRKLGQAFVAQGFTVEKFDPQFLTLALAPKALATTFQPTLKARASATAGANSVLRLTGESTATVMGRYFTYIAQVEGSEKGVPISSFRALEKAALAYPGGKVDYAKQ